MRFRSTNSLVALARAGDADAYAALLALHRPQLLRTCARVLADEAAAEDVAQDAALVAWLQLDRLREPENFGGWLAGIGRMLCLRALRERAASRERVTGADAPAAGADCDPADLVVAREDAARLAASISALPRGQREALVLYHLADLPQSRVATRLGTTAGAVRTRLHKARTALRQQLTITSTPIKEDLVSNPGVPARILDVRRTPADRHVVILATDDRELPIWIGPAEAEALVAGLQDVALPRPNAYALALALVRASGREPVEVRITRLDSSIFYAEVVLDTGAIVDARPSDALVLAVAAELPIVIDPAVLSATDEGVADTYADDLSSAPSGGAALLAGELRADLAARQAELAEVAKRPRRRLT